jgi:hypothetical protein
VLPEPIANVETAVPSLATPIESSAGVPEYVTVSEPTPPSIAMVPGAVVATPFVTVSSPPRVLT